MERAWRTVDTHDRLLLRSAERRQQTAGYAEKSRENSKKFGNSHAELMQPALRHAVCDVGL